MGRTGGPRGAARTGGLPEGRDGDRLGAVERQGRHDAPVLPDDVVPQDLDRGARSRLRTLSKENADAVARHLVMAGRLLEEDGEAAYAHAAEAVRRAGRVDVVREAAGITAYRTGRYAEALRELRTARRLGGGDDHVPLMADCERGLGRPERALALATEHAEGLAPEVAAELAIVVSGARLDLGEPEAALAALSTDAALRAPGELAHRVIEARAAALAACGRHAEAESLLATLPAAGDVDEEILVFDLADDDAEEEAGTGAEEHDDTVNGPSSANTESVGPGPVVSEEGV